MLVFARDACPRALVNIPKARVGVRPLRAGLLGAG